MTAALRCVLLFVVLLVGCARYYYGRPDTTATIADFGADSRRCTSEVVMRPDRSKPYGLISPELYRACMTSHGWIREKKSVPAPPGWFRGFEDERIVHVDALPEPEQESTATPGPIGGKMTREQAEELCRTPRGGVPSTTPLLNIDAFRRCVQDRMEGRQ